MRADRLHLGTVVLVFFGLISAEVARGQAVSELPRAEYYVAREMLGAGRTADAAEGFQAALQGARRIGNQRWVDSIPPLVLLGECYYLQGNLAAAVEQYDAALMLALNNPDWIDRVEVGPERLTELAIDSNLKSINWFPRSRPLRPLMVPEAIQIAIDPTGTQVAPPGIVIAPVSLVTRLDASEVLRTLGIALHRRWQILGPLARHSPISIPVARMFSRNPVVQVPWVQASWRVLRGLSQLATPTAGQAAETLRGGLQIGNEFDHFLTPRGLLVLGELESAAGAYGRAIGLFQDAVLLAGYYQQHLELASGLERLSAASTASRRVDLLQPFQRVAAWTSQRSLIAHAQASLGALELALASNDFGLGDRIAQQTGNALRGREQVLPRSVAKLSWLNARSALARGRTAAGRTALDNALQLLHGSAETGLAVARTFQIQLTLDLHNSGNLTLADAEQVLGRLLDDPSPVQWQDQPLENLAALTTASLPAYRRFLEMAAARGDLTAAAQRIDRLHRQRLYEGLPMAGLLLAWQSAVTTPANLLDARGQGAVQAAFQQFPTLPNTVGKMNNLLQQVPAIPLALDERQVAPDHKRIFNELATAAQSVEDAALAMAISRYSIPRYVPPDASRMTEHLNDLREGDLVLAYAVVGPKGYLLTARRDGMELWPLLEMEAVRSRLTMLLTEIGLVRRQAPILPSAVTAPSAAWRQTAQELRDLLMPKSVRADVAAARRLIIVPHEELWYVPFELLPDPSGGQDRPMTAARRIVYAPTVGMAQFPRTIPTPPTPVLGVQGQVLSPDPSLNRALSSSIAAAAGNGPWIEVGGKLAYPSPRWLRLQVGGLWTTQLFEQGGAPLGAQLIPPAKNQADPLGRWLELPVRAPAVVTIAGWNSAARSGTLDDGDALFLPACALMLSGTRGAVLSRWPVGGRSTADLLRRYWSEASHGALGEAWHRSVLALWADEYKIAQEPALLPAGPESGALVPGTHPLLWSGYLHIGDTATP